MNRSPTTQELLLEILKELQKLNENFDKPVNVYGENFADAIQNGIERGLRGINTNER